MYIYEGVGMLKTVIHSMVQHREAPRNLIVISARKD